MENYIKQAKLAIPGILTDQGVTGETTVAEYAGKLEDVIQNIIEPFGDLTEGFRAVTIDKHLNPLREKLVEAHSKFHDRTLSFNDQREHTAALLSGDANLSETFERFKSLINQNSLSNAKLGKSGAHKLLNTVIKQGIDNGVWTTRQEIIDLYESSPIDGETWATSKYTIDRLKKHLAYLDDHLLADSKRALEIRRVRYQEAVARHIEENRDREWTEPEIIDEKNKWRKEWGQIPAHLNLIEGGFTLDDQQRRAIKLQLTELADNYNLRPEVVQAVPDFRLRQEFMPIAIAQTQEKQTSRYQEKRKSLVGDAKKKMNIGPDMHMTSHGDAVVNALLQAFDSKYLELKSSGKFSDTEAVNESASYAIELLHSNEGRWKYTPSGPKKFPDINGTEAQRNARSARAIEVSEEMASVRALNRKDLGEKKLVQSKEEMEEILKGSAKNGKILDTRINYFSRLYGENPFHVLQQEAEGYGLKLEIPGVMSTIDRSDLRTLQSNRLTKTQLERIQTKYGALPTAYQTPPEARSIYSDMLTGIRRVEAGGRLDAMYPNTRLPGYDKMTIREVANTATGAVGIDQHMPRFLVARAKAAGLDPDTALFNAVNQEKLALVVIQEKLKAYGETPDVFYRDPDKALWMMSQIWAALPAGRDGVSYYPENNKAHMDYDEAIRYIKTVGHALRNSLI